MTGDEHDESTGGYRDGGTDSDAAVRGERFAGGPARSFLSSLADDARIFAADLAVDRAHVVMLAEQGVLEADTATVILGALDEIDRAGHEALPDGEDVMEAVETAVIDRVGEEGGRMHTARSRNDQVAADLRIRLRGDLQDAIERVLDCRAALLDVAEDERETVMPGYTHRQPAQPTTVAQWALSYERALARDGARLLAAHDRANVNPLGAAAFAGTTFDVDPERTADLLGFDGVVVNATDAVASRDFLVEAVSALAGLGSTLSGLADDVIEFASDGLIVLDDAYASTSSIMPQKKNPDAMELVRARAGDAAGDLAALLTTLHGLPRAYNRDLQRATGHAWDAVDAVSESVEVAAGAVATAEWPADRLEAAAAEGFATATGVADLLAAGGLPFRTAHAVVARAAASIEGTDADAPDVDAIAAALAAETDHDLADVADREAVAAALDPVESVASRDSPGGPAPAAVADQLATAGEQLDADEDALTARRQAVAAAAERREEAVATYV